MQDPTDPFAATLAAMPMPDGLARLESGVFAAIDEQVRSTRAGRRIGALSVAAALALGLVGGSVTGGASPAQAAAPIGMDAALAPSTLLLGR